MMRIVIAVMGAVCLPLIALAQEKPSGSPISVTAEVWSISVKESPKPLRRLIVHLLNVGKEPVIVLTEHLDMQSSGEDGKASIELGLNSKVTHDNHLVVPSLCSFAPVTLNPGEEADITLAFSEDPMLDMLPNPVSGTVQYKVSDFWGERLKIWHGSVSAEIKAGK